MKLVDAARMRPNKCAMLPQIPPDHPEGFIDPGVQLTGIDPYVYVSVVAVRECVKTLGWPEPETHAELVAAHDALGAELEKANAENADLNRQLDAIDVLEDAGITVTRHKQPNGKQEEVVA